MADSKASLNNLVPGFDFLQGLVKNTEAALPNIGQWIAPTLNPEELEKRIQELRTVQFWLEQNARLLGATIQALEVQRMTLTTLKTMNVSLGGLRDSLTLKTPASTVGAASPRQSGARKKPDSQQSSPAGAATQPLVDPMQWWGALTQQFTALATEAMKVSAGDGARNLAGAMVKKGLDAAGQSLKQAAAMPAQVARKAMSETRTAAERSATLAAKRRHAAPKR